MKQLKFSKSTLVVAIAGASLIAAGSAFAAPTTTPMASIADSWHNLGTGNNKGGTPNGGAVANKSLATAEVCVFCHTPHGGDNTASVPLWNRVLGSPAQYARYSDLGTSTFDATEAPIGSVSIACLSCHDGTNAIDNVINAPGSGGYAAGGARIGTTEGTDLDNATGQLLGTIVQNLGTDLTNDHPVSMQYAGGGVSGTTLGPTNDIDFIASGNPKIHPTYSLQTVAVTNSPLLTRLWWIERGADSLAATRDREDIILYSRTESDVGLDNIEQPFVECGSCHDPHNVDNPTFLRVSNGVNTDSLLGFPNANGSPSGLCLSCHIK